MLNKYLAAFSSYIYNLFVSISYILYLFFNYSNSHFCVILFAGWAPNRHWYCKANQSNHLHQFKASFSNYAVSVSAVLHTRNSGRAHTANPTEMRAVTATMPGCGGILRSRRTNRVVLILDASLNIYPIIYNRMCPPTRGKRDEIYKGSVCLLPISYA